jgi:hypothetical protein
MSNDCEECRRHWAHLKAQRLEKSPYNVEQRQKMMEIYKLLGERTPELQKEGEEIDGSHYFDEK